MHVGGNHGSPPCSPTRATTHHKLHMKKESRRHNHHTYHAHNRHKTDASQKNGWGKHGGEYLRGNEYRATRARCCVECRTLNTHLSTATYICGCPAPLRVATGGQTNTLVCAASSVCLRTHSYGCGEEHSFLRGSTKGRYTDLNNLVSVGHELGGVGKPLTRAVDWRCNFALKRL